jgi:hypothetical protein
MRLLDFLAEVFINTFGITRPCSPEQGRRVSLMLGGFLLVILVLVFGITGFLLYQLDGGR